MKRTIFCLLLALCLLLAVQTAMAGTAPTCPYCGNFVNIEFRSCGSAYCEWRCTMCDTNGGAIHIFHLSIYGSSVQNCTRTACPYCDTPITPLNHDYTGATWVSDGNGATHHMDCVRAGCTDGRKTENCSGGAATCVDKAVCADCNEEYGDALGHDWQVTGWAIRASKRPASTKPYAAAAA